MSQSRLIVLLAACLTVWSCSSDLNNPGGIIPPEDLLNSVHTDTTTIHAYFERDDTIRSDGWSRVLLGSYNDPVLGPTSSSFYTTLNVASKQTAFGPGAVVDSVVLRLPADGAYGDLSKFNSYQIAEVFEVTEQIPIVSLTDNTEEGYNSHNSFAYNPIPLGAEGFAPQFFPYKSEGKQFRIRLNNSFGERFLNADSIMPGQVNLLCKGLFVRISPSVSAGQSAGQGAICYFSIMNSNARVSIHFHNDAGPNKELRLITNGTGNAHFSVFNHNYSPVITSQIGDTSYAGTSLYMQSMEGLRVKLKFPYLLNYVDTQKIILNKAELIIPIDAMEDLSKYPVAPNILAYTLTNGLIDPFPDFPYQYYDSKYDAVNRQYRIVITQFLQQIITGEVPNDGIYLKLCGPAITTGTPQLIDATDAYRAVINSPTHSTLPLKLNLVYTRVDT